MQRNLSPKDLALVIGVSESSLKRWVDEGRLAAARTAGGHRRIALHEAVRFIRETNQTVVRPDLLGLTDLTDAPIGAVTDGAGDAGLLKALEAGHAEAARGLVLAQYLASRSFAGVCDGPITYAMHRVGELWRHADNGIMVEHRATEIVLDAVHQVRGLMPPVPDGAPVAVGSAAPGDPYMLPTLLAATTLLECGYRDVNLGANLPIDSLIAALREHRPRLVWLSISLLDGLEPIVPQILRLAQAASAAGAVLALGGRGVWGKALPPMPATSVVSSITELAALARGVKCEPPRIPAVALQPAAHPPAPTPPAPHLDGATPPPPPGPITPGAMKARPKR